MKILRFATEREVNEQYPGYKPVSSPKEHDFENITYYKLGSVIVKQDLFWRIGRFLKSLGLFFFTCCSKNCRKLSSRAWKEFKQQGIAISLYVQKHLEIEKTPNQKFLVSPTIAPNEKLEIALSQFQRRGQGKEELIQIFSKYTPDQIQQLVDSEQILEWRNLLTLFSFSEIHFPQELHEKIKQKIKTGLDLVESIIPSLNREELIALDHLQLAVHSKAVQELEDIILPEFLSDERTFLKISEDLLKVFFNLLLNKSEFRRSRSFDQNFLRNCQNIDLNHFSPETLRLLILCVEKLELTVPNLETLETQKVTDLVKEWSAHTDEFTCILKHFGSISDPSQRVEKLIDLFLAIENENEILTSLRSAKEEEFLPICRSLLQGSHDMNRENCQKRLQALLDELNLRSERQDMRDTWAKIAEESTVEQAVFLLKNPELRENVYLWNSILIEAIKKDAIKLIKLMPTIEDLKQCLRSLEINCLWGNTQEIHLLKSRFIHALSASKQLYPIILSENIGRLPFELIEGLTLEELKDCLNHFAPKIELSIRIDTNLNQSFLVDFFYRIFKNVLRNELNQENVWWMKFLACIHELSNYPQLLSHAFHGVILAIEKKIALPNRDLSYTAVREELEQSFQLLNQVKKEFSKHEENIEEYLKSLSSEFFSDFSHDLEEQIEIFRMALAMRIRQDPLTDKIQWMIKINYYNLPFIFLYCRQNDQNAIINALYENFKNPPRDVEPRMMHEALRRIRLVLYDDEMSNPNFAFSQEVLDLMNREPERTF